MPEPELTPIEKLSEALNQFVAEISSEPKMITGWILGYSTIRFENNGPELADEVHGMNYAIGEQTSMASFVGLASFLTIVGEKSIWSMLNDGDGE